jgi:hypothetical protein
LKSPAVANTRLVEFFIIGIGSLIAQTRAITRTSNSLSNSLKLLATLPLHSATALATATALNAEIEATISLMAAQTSSLKSLANSPFLAPKSGTARDWAECFESELLGYRIQFEIVNRERDDGKWMLDLFGKFDRSGERGGARLAVGQEEWRDLVEEVFEGALEERYELEERHTWDDGAPDCAAPGCALPDGGSVSVVADCGVTDCTPAPDCTPALDGTPAPDCTLASDCRNINAVIEDCKNVNTIIENKEDEEDEEDEEEEEEDDDWMVDGITDDAVEFLQVLAEGYTAWFLGCGYSFSVVRTSSLILLVAKDATDVCIGTNSELDWSVVQLVKSQYAVSGLGSDVIMRTAEVL